MNDTLQARILDPHTVLLGRGAEWIRLSLPWLARDLAELLYQARGSANPDASDLDKERIAALRLVLAKLEAGVAAPIVSAPSTPCPLAHYRAAALIEGDAETPAGSPIVWLLRPAQMFDLEARLARRDADAPTSLLVYSATAVMVGPVLAARDYCPLCLRYLASPVFGLAGLEQAEESYRLQAGLALARSVVRNADDVLVFEHDSLKVEAFLPFIGCPQCLPAF
jgi:hypothetical protein